MPNLKHLLDDLDEMGVEPEKVRILGQLHDSLVADLISLVNFLWIKSPKIPNCTRRTDLFI